jgi:hypothetical protein
LAYLSTVKQKFRECLPLKITARRSVRVPQNLDCPRISRKGTIYQTAFWTEDRSKDSGGDVLPNVLPLARKSSPKQREPRGNKVDYAIEI